MPRVAYINKMDRIGADFAAAARSVREKLRANAVEVNLPIGAEETFAGVVDLITMKAYVYLTEDLGATYEVREIPAGMRELAEAKRAELVERVAECDDAAMEKFVNGEALSEEELHAAIRRATIACRLVPLLAGSSFKNKGVQPLLDAVVRYLPSPLDLPPVKGHGRDGDVIERAPTTAEHFCALAFKVASDPFVEKLVYLRVYSGKIRAGAMAYNATRDASERVTKIFLMHSNNRTEIDEARAGDIVAVAGLKGTTTGDTLCDKAHRLFLEKMQVPEPVVRVAVEPKTKADAEKLETALRRLADEDPTFRTAVDAESGQTLISGMGELHLDIIVDRLVREFNVGVNVGTPQVSYKETLGRAVEAEGIIDRTVGQRAQFARVRVAFAPAERGSGFSFRNAVPANRLPRELAAAVEASLRQSMNAGVLCGFPVVDVACELAAAEWREVDSNETAFSIAAAMAYSEAMTKGRPTVLEPVMKLDIEAPDQYMGEIIGDLNARRGRVESIEAHGESRRRSTVVSGVAPLAETFGYATALRSLTQGRGTYSMHFFSYEPPPSGVAREIVQRIRGVIPEYYEG